MATADPRAKSKAEQILGPVEWLDEISGNCRCPGEHLHTHPTRKRDASVFIDGVPTMFCWHHSCSMARDDANRRLRKAILDDTPAENGEVKQVHIQRDPEAEIVRRITTIAKMNRERYLTGQPWDIADMFEESPQSQEGGYQTMLTLFDPQDIIWVGDIKDSGRPEHKANFKTVEEWAKLDKPVGQFITASTYKPGTVSRSNETVIKRKYLVVESDEHPKDVMGALFRMMQDTFKMKLHAVVDTAGKSLHGWFEMPPHAEWERQLKSFLIPLGCCSSTFKASQPVRIPGADRNGKVQSLLWFSQKGHGGDMVEPAVALGLKAAAQSWPPIKSFAKLSQENIAEPTVLIDGLLHQGCKLLLGGGSKAFKSWSLIDLAISLHTGTEWWGLKCHPARVLFINFEIQEWSFKNRLIDVAKAKGMTERIGDMSIWTLRGYAADLTSIRPIIEKHIEGKGYQAIILDPNYMLMGERDENNAGDMAQLMNEFELLAVRHNLSVVLSHHFAKGNASGKESIDRFSGSGVFARNPDSLVVLTPHEEDDRTFTCDITLRNFPPMDPFVVQWKYPLFQTNFALNPDNLKKPGARKVVDDERFLKEMGSKEWQAGELCRHVMDKCQISESTAYRALKRLVKAEKVLHENGLYSANQAAF